MKSTIQLLVCLDDLKQQKARSALEKEEKQMRHTPFEKSDSLSSGDAQDKSIASNAAEL